MQPITIGPDVGEVFDVGPFHIVTRIPGADPLVPCLFPCLSRGRPITDYTILREFENIARQTSLSGNYYSYAWPLERAIEAVEKLV